MSQFLPSRLTAWSYSRFSDYCKCPQLAFYKHVKKLKEPDNPAMERGSAIHKLAEEYVKGTRRALPPELAKFKEAFGAIKKNKALVEQEWGFTVAWQPSSWFDMQNTWCRIKVDVADYRAHIDTLLIVDHKTGKKRPGNELQMDLYAVGGFLTYPTAKFVRTELWYLDEGGPPVTALYEVENFPTLKKDWEGRVKPMMTDKTFKPKPGAHCRWCHFRKDNGGPCKF